MGKRDDKKLLEEARERFKACTEADQDNRRLAVDDLEFLHEPGEQWDATLKAERGTRPCYEFPKLRTTIKRIVNDIRANRPQGKVRATEDGDKGTAETIEGLIRNIWVNSDADCAIDTAAEYQVGGGMGAWRINTKYSTDDAWDQDIVIEPIRNPFALWCDPAARDPMKRDARFWFLESKLAKDVYEERYGSKPAIDFDGSDFDDDEEWTDEDAVRVCEYWYRKPLTKTIALLDDGRSVDVATLTPESLLKVDDQGQPMIGPDGQPVMAQVMRTREVQTWQICQVLMSGDKVLDGPNEWAGPDFPFVMVFGESVVIDGTPKWWGLTRFAKDAQRLHNFTMTLAAETAALAPQQKWWATPTQAEGNTTNWARAHKENLPYLIYNPDPMAGGPPITMPGAQMPAAFVQLGMITSEEIKAVTGIYDASLGNQSNETSGVAIRSRQAQGEIATFNYSDNMARGVRRTWEILVRLVPQIYDTERAIRVLGSDGAEKFVKVNGRDPMTGQVINDLSRGKYDVAVTVGPNFSTQRQEASEIYTQLAQGNPAVFGVAGDLIFKAMDLPYSDDIAERMKAILPPQVQQMLQSKEQGKYPPEVMAAMAQVDQAMQQVQMHGQVVQQAAQEAEGVKAEAEKAVSDLESKRAQLEADYQRMLADIAKKEAALVLKEANLVSKQAEAGVTEDAQAVAQDREALSNQVQQAMAQMQQGIAEFMSQAAQTIAQIQANAQPQVVVANQPRRKTVSMVGPGGRTYNATVEES